jgi:predicted MFS family arabinose efflux permease
VIVVPRRSERFSDIDETGHVNVAVRRELPGSQLLAVYGKLERLGEVTHLIAGRFRDLTPLLGRYGLGAISKPLFALATSSGLVFAARVIDRVGKGVRGAPRDALLADIAPPAVRGAAFGLRQSLDTVGAFLGPLFAMRLMLAWADKIRAVFSVAIIPGYLAVLLLFFGVPEPEKKKGAHPVNPIRREQPGRLSARYGWVVLISREFSMDFLVSSVH